MFIQVEVEEHEEIPDGCSLRFRAAPGASAPRPVTRVTYEAEDGTTGVWIIEAESADGARTTALAIEVDDSGAGTSTLVYGGARGLRLTLGATTAAEPYLLLDADAIDPPGAA